MARPAAPADFVLRVAQRIAATRVQRGMTQEALASILDIATKNVQRLESGRQNLTLRTVERVAAALHVEPESFFDRAQNPPAAPVEVMPRVPALQRLAEAGFAVGHGGADRLKGSVPVVSLQAAAGAFSLGSAAVHAVGWVKLPQRAGHTKGWFVAEAQGDSMHPRIPNGALVLFRPVQGVAPLGRVVLLEHLALHDPDFGGPYAIKVLSRIEHRVDHKLRVTLGSDNPRFAPLVLTLEDPEELRVLAELVEVLVR